jgi:hypothetical protein
MPLEVAWDWTQDAAVTPQSLTASDKKWHICDPQFRFGHSGLNRLYNLNNSAFWAITARGLLKVNWSFGGTPCLHLQQRRISREGNQNLPDTCITVLYCQACSSALTVEAVPVSLKPWGRLSLEQKWVPGIFLGIKGGQQECMADNLTANCQLSVLDNVGASTSHNPTGLHSVSCKVSVTGLGGLLVVRC